MALRYQLSSVYKSIFIVITPRIVLFLRCGYEIELHYSQCFVYIILNNLLFINYPQTAIVIHPFPLSSW